MPNRTVQIRGYGYGSTTCSASVSYNGNTVFSGAIPTLDQPQVLRQPLEQVVLFTFDIDIDASGTFPLIVNVTGGNTVWIEQVMSNYARVPNPVYNASDWAIVTNPTSTIAQKLAVYETLAQPPLSEADIAVLEQGITDPQAQLIMRTHGIRLYVSGGADNYGSIASSVVQAKSNVVINGAGQQALSTPLGEWGYEVYISSGTGTFTCDLIVDPGLEE
jgi:hypothetical protein